jgi:putative membrane fusion protein
MAAYFVIGRRRVRLRFFFFLAMLLFGALYLFTSIFDFDRDPTSASFATVAYGQVDMNISGPAIIIREEEVFTAPAYGKAVYLAADGVSVTKDQPVAILYKENFDESIIGQLYSVQERIILYQQDQLLGQVIDGDISKLKSDIEYLVLDVQSMVRDNRLDSLPKMENQLRSLLAQKQKLLDYRTEPDSYLKGLYDEEARILNYMKDWTINIIAPESGLISFQLDGLENILGINSVDKLTSYDFEQIMEHVPKYNAAEDAKAEQPFFRMVDPLSNWYIAIQSHGNEEYFNRGDKVQVSFEDGSSATASIYRINREKGNSFLVLEFSGNVDRIINKRVTPVSINKTVEGLVIPKEALVHHKGKRGVFLKDREEMVFIETSVKALSESKAIVESISDNMILKLHDQVMTGKQ